jgi:5-formyltetrahydrofolate cyclo-ligase
MRSRASAELCERLRAQPLWRAAQSILCFVPTHDEPDIWPLIAEALAEGRRVLLPRYSPTTDTYVAATMGENLSDLQPGQFGILEPTPDCPIYNLKQLDLALVPGLGFALNGVRLGRGQGYYDRLLDGCSGFKCGVAFDCQVTAEIPAEAHDVRVDCLLTPSLWHVA